MEKERKKTDNPRECSWQLPDFFFLLALLKRSLVWPPLAALAPLAVQARRLRRRGRWAAVHREATPQTLRLLESQQMSKRA